MTRPRDEKKREREREKDREKDRERGRKMEREKDIERKKEGERESWGEEEREIERKRGAAAGPLREASIGGGRRTLRRFCADVAGGGERDRMWQNNYFTEMCSGSEAGSYLRLIDVVYHSTLGLRVRKKSEKGRVAACLPLSDRRSSTFAHDVLSPFLLLHFLSLRLISLPPFLSRRDEMLHTINLSPALGVGRSAAERRGCNLKRVKDVYLKAKARIWLCLSCMCHIRSIADSLNCTRTCPGTRTDSRMVSISYANTYIHKLGFNQNYYTFTSILLIKIVVCSKFP